MGCRTIPREEVAAMRHDPEQLAARFLDGQMRRPERWRYERHLVECAECWTHVQRARAGRSAAESLREVAPARAREGVRAVPELDAPDPPVRRRPRQRPLVVAVAAILAAVTIGVVTHDDRSREAVATEALTRVADAYRDSTAWAASAVAPPVERLGGLRWVGTRVTAIDDDRVLAFRYTDGAEAVLVVQRDGAFAIPPDADPVPGGEWVTDVDGVTVFCTHLPESVLVVGAQPGLVARAAHTLTEERP
jgi:anti-sigma factor RsiW